MYSITMSVIDISLQGLAESSRSIMPRMQTWINLQHAKCLSIYLSISSCRKTSKHQRVSCYVTLDRKGGGVSGGVVRYR